MPKKKMSVQQKKWRQQFNMECLQRLNERRAAAFKATTLEQRRQFIADMHAGKKVGEAYIAAGISQESAFEILRRNYKPVTYHILSAVEDVK